MDLTDVVFPAPLYGLVGSVFEGEAIPPALAERFEELKQGLATNPELELKFFRKYITRRPNMRGLRGFTFGDPKLYDNHWTIYNVGGDQDQVQLNIGLYPDWMRIGIGFMMGRQVSPKMPVFFVLQALLGMRPPIPFRSSFYKYIERVNAGIEYRGDRILGTPERILETLETTVIPNDDNPVFLFVGELWERPAAESKTLQDYVDALHAVMPFYQALILTSGRAEVLV